jgi:hypothetical protein
MFWFDGGIASIQSLMAEKISNVRMSVPDYLIPSLKEHFLENQLLLMDIWKEISISNIVQVVDSVRNRLLQFILELDRLYPNLDMEIQNIPTKISQKEIQNLVYQTIYVQDGGRISGMDQSKQIVQGSQYIVRGNISFTSVSNTVEFLERIQSLQLSIDEALLKSDIDEETAIEVKYQLEKAVVQAKKQTPEKIMIKKYLESVKSLLAKSVAMAGYVVTISEAIEVADKIF